MCGDKGSYREVAVDPGVLERVAGDPGPRPGEAPEAQSEKAELRGEAIALLATIIRTKLTPRQREMVQLYFWEEKTQEEIAAMLGISQQVVSKQLFGVMRKGKKVGGAVHRLRKLLRESGITFD